MFTDEKIKNILLYFKINYLIIKIPQLYILHLAYWTIIAQKLL